MRCEKVSHRLAKWASDPQDSMSHMPSQVANCLRCRGEIAKNRRLRRDLQWLSNYSIEPPPSLLPDLLERLSHVDLKEPVPAFWAGRRVAYVVGLASAAGAASAVGVAVLAGKGRSRGSLVG